MHLWQLVTPREIVDARTRSKQRGSPSHHVLDVTRVGISDQVKASKPAQLSNIEIEPCVSGRRQSTDAQQRRVLGESSSKIYLTKHVLSEQNRSYRCSFANATDAINRSLLLHESGDAVDRRYPVRSQAILVSALVCRLANAAKHLGLSGARH